MYHSQVECEAGGGVLGRWVISNLPSSRGTDSRAFLIQPRSASAPTEMMGLKITNRIARGRGSHGAPCDDGDIVGDELRGAVTEGGMDSDGMPTAGGDCLLQIGGTNHAIDARRIQSNGG